MRLVPHLSLVVLFITTTCAHATVYLDDQQDLLPGTSPPAPDIASIEVTDDGALLIFQIDLADSTGFAAAYVDLDCDYDPAGVHVTGLPSHPEFFGILSDTGFGMDAYVALDALGGNAILLQLNPDGSEYALGFYPLTIQGQSAVFQLPLGTGPPGVYIGPSGLAFCVMVSNGTGPTDVTPIYVHPEPATALLTCVGIVALIGRRHCRHHSRC